MTHLFQLCFVLLAPVEARRTKKGLPVRAREARTDTRACARAPAARTTVCPVRESMQGIEVRLNFRNQPKRPVT